MFQLCAHLRGICFSPLIAGCQESNLKALPSPLKKTLNAIAQACPGIKPCAAFLSGHEPKPTDFNALQRKAFILPAYFSSHEKEHNQRHKKK